MKNENISSKVITAAIGITLFVIVIMAGMMINKNKNVVKQLSSENAQLEMVVQERDSLVNEFISAFDTIENSLTFISERRGQLVLADKEMSVSQKDIIVSDIQLMNTMLEESSAKIEELEAKLKKSGIQLTSFKKKIASLSKKIQQQNNEINELQFRFEEQNQQLAIVSFEKDSLQNEVLSILDTIQVREELISLNEEIINQQTDELNKGFIAYGTTKELTDNGVMKKVGGFLGMGRNKILPNNFNENYFTKIDISEQRSIKLNAKKVNLVSEHPDGSYKLIEEDGLITELEIDIPQDFWKISHYAVIEIK